MQIIHAAIEVFKRKGYEASTMQDIVEETGMSRGWVYLYFSSKEDMMQAILVTNQKEQDTLFKTLFTSEHSVWAGVNKIFDIMEAQLNDASDDLIIAVYEYFLSGWRLSDRRSFLDSHFEKKHESLFYYLQKGVANGEFKPEVDLEVIMKMITSYFDGLLLHTKSAGCKNVRVKEQLILFKSILKKVLQVHDLEGDL